MLSLGPFPRFAGSTIKNIETSWRKVAETFGIDDAGGEIPLHHLGVGGCCRC